MSSVKHSITDSSSSSSRMSDTGMKAKLMFVSVSSHSRFTQQS